MECGNQRKSTGYALDLNRSPRDRHRGFLMLLLAGFTCLVLAAGAEASPAYPLVKSSNGRYLVDQRGVPFLMVGDSPHSLVVNLSEADAATYLADRKAHGFNSLWVETLCNVYTGGRGDGSTIDGTLPFTNSLLPASTNYDLTTPNEVYFEHLDRVISMAATNGLLVLLDPIETGGWLDGPPNGNTTMLDNGVSRCNAYGQFLGNRYRNFTNILWINGNDFQTWPTPGYDAVALAVAEGIQEMDTNHLQTIELDYPVSSSLDDTNWVPIVGLNGAYTYFPTYAEVLQAYRESSSTPVSMIEANYEFEDDYNDLGVLTPKILRLQEYWTLLSGACGQVYGNHYTWTFIPGWQTNMDTPGAAQLGYVTALFGSRAWYNLVPDTNHLVVTSGYGTFATSGTVLSSDYATAASAPDGTLAIVYMPTARTLTVNLSALSAPVTGQWYDPAAGSYISIPGSPFNNQGLMTFTPPATNSAGDTDWVLVFDKAVGLPTFIQQNYATPQTLQTSVSVAYPSAQTASNANVLAIGWIDASASISSVSDSAGNAYQIAVPTQRGSGLSQAIYYAANIKAGSNTVTVTFNQPATLVDLRAVEYSGLSATNPFDAGASAAGNGSLADSGAAVVSQPTELIFGAGVTSNDFTAAGSGYALRVITSPTGDIAEDFTASAAGSYHATAYVSGAAPWVMQVAAFKAADPQVSSPLMRLFLPQPFTLQQNAGFATTNWTDVTNSVQLSGLQYQYLVSRLGVGHFYRLKSTQGVAPPLLGISPVSTNNVIVSWPATVGVAWPKTAIGFRLQHTANLAASNWLNYTNAIQSVGSEYQAAVPILGSQQFYRLIYP